MAPTRHPLIELVYNDDTGVYIGMLERKLVMFERENIRMRALLTMLTGDMWEDTPMDAEDKAIFDLAVNTLKKRLQMSHEDAKALVSDRWTALNPPEPDPALATYMIGPTREPKMPHVVSHARQIKPGQGAPFDHKKHVEGLEIAKRHRGKRSD